MMLNDYQVIMAKKKKIDPIEAEEKYVAFLRKQLDSVNYKEAVSEEEFKKTKFKYDKAKFRLKMMKEKVKR